MHRWPTFTIVALTATMLAACSNSTEGQAQPKAADNSEPTLPHSGAPKVSAPLSASELRTAEQNPCGTLTQAQIDELGLNPEGKFENAEAGPLCRWRDTESRSFAAVYFPTDVIHQGLRACLIW